MGKVRASDGTRALSHSRARGEIHSVSEHDIALSKSHMSPVIVERARCWMWAVVRDWRDRLTRLHPRIKAFFGGM